MIIKTALKELDYSIFTKIENIVKTSFSKELFYCRNYENWCYIHKREECFFQFRNVLSFGVSNSETFEIGVFNYSVEKTEPVYTKVFCLEFPLYLFEEYKVSEILKKYCELDDMKELKKQIHIGVKLCQKI